MIPWKTTAIIAAVAFIVGANFGIWIMCLMSLAKKGDDMSLRNYVYARVKGNPGEQAKQIAKKLERAEDAVQECLNSLVTEKLIAEQFGRYWARR